MGLSWLQLLGIEPQWLLLQQGGFHVVPGGTHYDGQHHGGAQKSVLITSVHFTVVLLDVVPLRESIRGIKVWGAAYNTAVEVVDAQELRQLLGVGGLRVVQDGRVHKVIILYIECDSRGHRFSIDK